MFPIVVYLTRPVIWNIFLILLYPVSALSVEFDPQFDYCSLNCERRVHTLCAKHFPKRGGSACRRYEFGIDKRDRQLLLDEHNKRRQLIASGRQAGYPPAANMMVLTWHSECAVVAQRWTDQCRERGHDQCYGCRGGAAGQSLWDASGQPGNDTRAVEDCLRSWYDDEVDTYRGLGFSVDRCDFGRSPVTGHFTAVVWARTRGVGCGLRRLRREAGWSYAIVCNYYPAGNSHLATVYEQGEPCSRCPRGARCSLRYPALCAYPGEDTRRPPDRDEPSRQAVLAPSPALPALLVCATLIINRDSIR